MALELTIKAKNHYELHEALRTVPKMVAQGYTSGWEGEDENLTDKWVFELKEYEEIWEKKK